MPRRTTPFQMVVHSVRKQTASPGVTVTESKELLDARLNVKREVDVVVEGNADGDPFVTSIEVIEQGRPASITWVEQQIGKHRTLPTTCLILVSKSGFRRNALTAVAAEGGWVCTMSPRLTDAGDSIPGGVFLDEIQLKPTTCVLIVEPPDGSTVIDAPADLIVYDSDENPRGYIVELSREFVGLPGVVRTFMKGAHNHIERDELSGFVVGGGIGDLNYYLRREETGRLHAIRGLEVTGTFGFRQTHMPFTANELGGRRYGAGEGLIFGRPGVWVATTDEAARTTTISWRMKDDKPLFDPPAPEVPEQ